MEEEDKKETKENKEESKRKSKKTVTWNKDIYLYMMPYYNRKVKSLDIESIRDHAREKIKIELDDFKRNEMRVHKDSINNTTYYYPERNALHKQYSFFSRGNPFSSQNKSRSSPKSIEDFFKL